MTILLRLLARLKTNTEVCVCVCDNKCVTEMCGSEHVNIYE